MRSKSSSGTSQRGEHEAAAHALDLEHGAEAGQRAFVQHAFQPGKQIRFGEAERLRNFAVGLVAQREVALERVDDPPVGVVQWGHAAGFSGHRSSGRPAA